MPVLTESLKIEIDGEELTDVYGDLVALEVDLDEDLPATFRFRLPLLLQKDGTWRFLDDERFRAWKAVAVSAGLGDEVEELVSGYITHVKPAFDADPTQSSLEIWGLDSSVLMEREDKRKDWPNKKDSDVAAEIFSQYGLSSEVDDSQVTHDEAVSTIIQRETDWQFLKRLSLRNGFECFVEGGTGYFRRTRVDAEPQALLAVHFGDDTNVSRFAIEVNALTPADVTMAQVDRTSKEALDATADGGDQPALGAMDAAAIVGPGMPPALMIVGKTATTGSVEMADLCRGLFREREWFVTGEGEMAGNAAGVVLKPRRTVTIKGIGETFSGVYLVSHVTHSFSEDGYVQRFDVKRNALLPTGSEDFAGGAGSLLDGLV